MKKKFSGDGGRFYDEVALSPLDNEAIYKAMDVSQGTFYRLYRKVKWEDDEKEAAATALGKKVKDIFPPQSTDTPQAPNKRRVPILGEGLAGTDMELNVTDTVYSDDYIDVGDLLKDSEAAFVVYGNSMTPSYPPGCVVGIKRNYDSFIQPGETYLLLTKSNRVLKRLYYNVETASYKCFSDNILKHEHGPMSGEYFYPPFEVSKDDVISIFDVTGMIKRNRNSGIIQRQK